MPTLELTRVYKAAPSEKARCIAALLTAFVDDPLLRWMMPDPAVYLEFFPQAVAHYGGRAFVALEPPRLDHIPTQAPCATPGRQLGLPIRLRPSHPAPSC